MRNESFEVPLGQLVRVIRGLVRALAETGLGAGEIDAVLRHRLVVECVGCGIPLHGDETAHLAIDQDAPPDEPAKLNRLRFGYCARSSCESRYYRIRVTDPTGFDWPALFPRAAEWGTRAEAAPAVAEDAKPANPDRPPRPRAGRRRLLLTGLVLAAVLALWHFWDQLPFSAEKPPKYRIDPSSLPRY